MKRTSGMRMYVPQHFSEERTDPLISFLDGQGLASLIHSDGKTIDVTHVPVFRREPVPAAEISSLEGLVLITHVARANPLWRRLQDSPHVTVTWLGDQSYISADWYDEHRSVPTWNYSALHLHCFARTFDDPPRLRSVLERTAEIFEPVVGGAWTLAGGDPSYIAGLQRGIVGIELTVLSQEAIFKLHQNHPPENVLGVVAGLRRQKNTACHAVADSMLERLSERSPPREAAASGGRETW
ncbi:MAG: FMN-binding negative transcriptional regulator [Pseudaminobacter sp.]|nr:FMN-binding negative transcriptional regulator [Pseudaminobacter sp.]